MNKNMSDTLPVICENAGRTIEVAMGTTLLEVERQLRLDGPHPFLAAYVNNRIKELNYRIYKPVTVRFIDITSFEGIRVYQRTISFILQKAVRELFPDRTLYIRHSLGASGFYCEISGFGPIPAEHLDAIKARMRGIIDRNLPIQGVKMLTDTARKIYEGFGMADKIALLDSRPRLYSKIYTIDSLPGYFYGALPLRRVTLRSSTCTPITTASSSPCRCGPTRRDCIRASTRRRCSTSSTNTSRGWRSWAFRPSDSSTRKFSRATPAS